MKRTVPIQKPLTSYQRMLRNLKRRPSYDYMELNNLEKFDAEFGYGQTRIIETTDLESYQRWMGRNRHLFKIKRRRNMEL